jgi:hypothetical protein
VATTSGPWFWAAAQQAAAQQNAATAVTVVTVRIGAR